MIKNFLDADEDDSLSGKKSLKEEPEDEKEFTEFAAPFSQIEREATDLLEIPDAEKSAPPLEEFKENPVASNENEIAAPEIETTGESFNETANEFEVKEFSEPKFDKSKEEKFWEKQLASLKSEKSAADDQPDDLKPDGLRAEDFQDDDFETVTRQKSDFGVFDLAENNAPENFQPPVENERVNFEPPTAEQETGFILPNLEKNQSFADSINEIKNETGDETNGVRRRDDATLFSQSPYHSETPDETIRKSGLAYTAAIVLTASIVFTLILGWFADLLLGTSPWGKVGGIILGAIIGFVQFFRTTAQIFKNKN